MARTSEASVGAEAGRVGSGARCCASAKSNSHLPSQAARRRRVMAASGFSACWPLRPARAAVGEKRSISKKKKSFHRSSESASAPCRSGS